ncbi:FAD-dependent monooxygenase [Actinoplanes sp. NPDC024001]|uniref:FAD-dependent oxidoreductase n=1 Tax=Actinoplanes sp. NPDC024001 TaxID=3154598 RepID=UPI0033D6B4DC
MSHRPADVFERLSSTRPPEAGTRPLRRAIVLGGSVAGLLAARVLADHAAEVIVVERDDVGRDAAGGRRGVPQQFQVHTLLPGGRAQIERLFPGFTEEAVSLGAVLSLGHQVQAWADDVRAVQTPNAVLLSESRTFLETLLRHRTLALGNVRSVRGIATGLGYRDGQVTAVRIDDQEIPADFVVDAMGRASRLSDWLDADGWERPELERMRIDVNYATAYFRRAHQDPPIGAAISRFSPHYRKKTQAAVTAIEDMQWMLMLTTYGEDRLLPDLGDFLARCEDLPPLFQEIAREEPAGDVRVYRQTDARRRRFDRLTRLPGRLVSVGDAVASFNPVYGQGMSSAALHASCLAEYLSATSDPAQPATHFFQLQKVVVDAAWDLSTSGDAQRLETAKPPASVRVQRALINQVIAASTVDLTIATKFNDVAFMRTHPSTLATPAVLLRSVVVNLRHRLRGRPAPQPAAPEAELQRV